jgi:hypothetical protein
VILQGANRLGGAPASVLSGQYGLVLDDLPASPLLFTRGKQATSKQQLMLIYSTIDSYLPLSLSWCSFDKKKLICKTILLDG